ncbi:MAG: SIS domain-containing protein [Anaerolineae bacterium]
MSLHSEICEQPQRLADLLVGQRGQVERIAAAIRDRDVRFAFLAARGTSDNAGRYAMYLWGARNGLPLALAAPSLFTFYQQPPRLRDALVVGVSQSGQSPDIVQVLTEGRRQGCLTLAITNAPASPLAQTADFVLDIQAGPEHAVAATKTYTAELMSIAMLSAALSDDAAAWQELRAVPSWIETVLQQDETLRDLARRYRFLQQCVVIGRGYNYATAFEWSLKLKELTYEQAEPYSAADFQHGPMAMIEPGFPVLAVAPSGRMAASLLEFITYLRRQQQADLMVLSDQASSLALAQAPVSLPAGIPEWLSPLVSIVPAQLFCYHLTRGKGFDTEQPRSIHKITETR